MPVFLRRRVLSLILLLLGGGIARAQSADLPEEEPAWWHLGAGISGALDVERNAYVVLSYYFARDFGGLHPYTVVSFASDSAYYVGGGLLYNHDLTHRFRVTAGTGPGYYDRNRPGTDLGHSLEFLSTIELSYAPSRASRIGVGLSHLSNGHLSRINPGTELIQLTYAIRTR